MLNFEFELNEVKDGLYGHYSRKASNWTGLVGELLREVGWMQLPQPNYVPLNWVKRADKMFC